MEKAFKKNANKVAKINWKKYFDTDEWDTEEIKDKINN